MKIIIIRDADEGKMYGVIGDSGVELLRFYSRYEAYDYMTFVESQRRKESKPL